MDLRDEFAQRVVALALATVHHGMANHSTRSAPAMSETVIRTADSFCKYISAGTVPSVRRSESK